MRYRIKLRAAITCAFNASSGKEAGISAASTPAKYSSNGNESFFPETITSTETVASCDTSARAVTVEDSAPSVSRFSETRLVSPSKLRVSPFCSRIGDNTVTNHSRPTKSTVFFIIYPPFDPLHEIVYNYTRHV